MEKDRKIKIRGEFEESSNYPCPFCLQGELKNIFLMEALSCNFCQHIFTLNLEQQILKIEDSQLPISWQCKGNKWLRVREKNEEIGWGYWLGAVAFIFCPTILVATGAYLFPPLEGSRLAWFPLFWTISAFISHLVCVLWLIIEYYQFPLGLYLRGKLQGWLIVNN